MRTQRFRPSILILALWLLCALIMPPVSLAAEGKLVYDTVHSPALEGNLLGDSADRSVIVYLPPSYETSLEKHYPVVYLLHGGICDNYVWVGGGICGGIYGGFHMKTVMDRLIANGKIREMIIVMPDTNSSYFGAFYTNSPVLGNYEDYLTRELVKYVDDHYRTLPQPASRGITGHSLGGYGAFYLALMHLDVYGAVYGHDPAFLKFETSFGGDLEPSIVTAIAITKSKDMKQLTGAAPFAIQMFAAPASFSPNPENPPFFVDWPWEVVDGQLKPIEPLWRKWLEFEPLTIVTRRSAEIR